MYQPDFKLVEPYVKNYLKKNYWKVEGFMDRDDVLSEARLQFIRTIQRLQANGNSIKNEAHAMSLFKTSWSRHFITLANKATQQRFVVTVSDVEYETFLLDQVLADDTFLLFEQRLKSAPSAVKKVIKLMQSVDDEKFKQISKMFYQNRQQCNQELCRQLGKDPNIEDLINQTLDFIGV